MKFAIEVDGTSKDAIPTTPKASNQTKYYKVEATCDDGITAEWDYNAWNLKVENINKGTKCKLAFNSTLSEDDYKKYIDAGVAYRRNTYRGKDITEYLENGKLFTMISSGKFDDIFVGDYITSPTSKSTSTVKDVNGGTVIWLIADLDNYLNSGDTGHELTRHHATIIPAVPLMNAPMNSSDTTTGGYAGSDMVKTTLTTVLNKYIVPDFDSQHGSHVIEYSSILTTSVDETLSTPSASHGMSKTWEYQSRKLDLMSEVNVTGTTAFSSSAYDIGNDHRQYAIFQLKPEFINSYENKRFEYWLKGVNDYRGFTCVYSNGILAGHGSKNNLTSVRPRFLIG